MKKKKAMVTDLEGGTMKVTNLEGAITRAKTLKDLYHEKVKAAQQPGDEIREAYWEDLYQKLCELQQAISTGK